MENYTENNIVDLTGRISKTPIFNHEIFGEGFYLFYLDIERLSGNVDCIPVLFSERLIEPAEIFVGKWFSIRGQFRSYNVTVNNGGHRLKLLVFAKEVISHESDQSFQNEIILNGFVCKAPTYRTTPFGREITDLLFAVNRAYNKSDYLPCVVWGRDAKFCGELPVGAHAMICGRIQSRQYDKKFKDGTVKRNVAFEVSVNTIEVVE